MSDHKNGENVEILRGVCGLFHRIRPELQCGRASLVGLLGWMSAMHADTVGNAVNLNAAAIQCRRASCFGGNAL
jgi:hypothetical protein